MILDTQTPQSSPKSPTMEHELEMYRAKNRLIRDFSYEFRTLISCFNYVYLLLKTPLTPEQQQYVEIMKRTKEIFVPFMNDVFDFITKDIEGKQIEYWPLDIREILNSLASGTQYITREDHLTVSITVDPDVPQFVLSDAQLFRKLLSYQLKNALLYGTVVQISVSAVPSATEQQTTSGLYRFRFCVQNPEKMIPSDTIQFLQQFFAQHDQLIYPSERHRICEDPWNLTMLKILSEQLGGIPEVENDHAQRHVQFCWTIQLREYTEETKTSEEECDCAS
jgi:signal transduction histidine kinase